MSYDDTIFDFFEPCVDVVIGCYEKLTEEQYKAKMREIYWKAYSSVMDGRRDGAAEVLDKATSPLASGAKALTDNETLIAGAEAAEMLLPGGALKKVAKTGAKKIVNKVTSGAIKKVAAKNVNNAASKTKPLLGRNPRVKKGRTLTDLDPVHDRATAKSIFRKLTKGERVVADPVKGDAKKIMRRGIKSNIRIRMTPEGKTRLDLPGRGTQKNGETIHFNPKGGKS